MKYILPLVLTVLMSLQGNCENAQNSLSQTFDPGSVLEMMYRVHGHFTAHAWKQNDRNWIRATYYTGLMAFYQVSHDSVLLTHMRAWGQKHGWKTGSEWVYPANRLACTQTWMQLYLIDRKPYMIENTKSFMDKRIARNETAFNAGWDYVDALYVGAPAYFMMSGISGQPDYKMYAHRLFTEVSALLYDPVYHLYYRDLKARAEPAENNKPEFWARGNGWAFAALPRMLNSLSPADTLRAFYTDRLREMAASLAASQQPDGFWRSSLLNPTGYPDPESSATAFFTYGLAWGINNGILDKETYLPVVSKAWNALYHAVDENGKVGWGQDVARAPGSVSKSSSREFVAGAFLLAASEIFKLSVHQSTNE